MSQHQPPRGQQHVEPVDPVIQGVKPELRFLLGLLTQLPSQLGDFRRQLDSGFHLRWDRRLILPRRLAAFFRSGTLVQAVLLTSDENANLAGDLGSTAVTPLPRYYVPLRLPTKPARGYVFPWAVVPTQALSWDHRAGSLRFLDRSVDIRRPQPPRGVPSLHVLVTWRLVAGFARLGRLATPSY